MDLFPISGAQTQLAASLQRSPCWCNAGIGEVVSHSLGLIDVWWRDVVFGAGEQRWRWMPAPDCVDILPSQVAGLDIADLLRWTLASGNCSGNGHMDVEG